MSKVLFFCIPAHGHVNPTLPLVEKLVENGEQVVYYCADEFRAKIEQTGAEFRALNSTWWRIGWNNWVLASFLSARKKNCNRQ
jgi:UDP:flavonoid glycosyltransferase YjiC (YdhE family)